MARLSNLLLGATAGLGLLAQPLWAEDQALRSAEVKTFVEAMVAQGCTLTEDTAETTMETAGLDNESTMAALMTLLVAEILEEGPNNTLVLKKPYCEDGFAALPEDKDTPLAALAIAAEADGEAEAALIAAITARDCKFERSQADAVLAETGLDPETADATADSLIEQGLLVENGETLVLQTEGCQ